MFFILKTKKYINELDIISNMSLDKVILKLILFNLKKRKKKPKKRINKLQKKINKKKSAASICSLTQILINKAIEKVKETPKKEKNKEGKIIYSTKEERVLITNGGYGTVSKVYGTTPVVKYTDYGKLFSHLGTFRAKGMYEDLEEREMKTKQMIASTREMVSTETMEKAAKHFKYFLVGELMTDVGYVPPVGIGINSKDWEKYRLMTKMSIYQPLIKLKNATA